MKSCPSCFSEYRDEAQVCDACQVPLVSAEEAARLRGTAPAPDPESPGFVVVATAEDPFDAEAFVAALREADIPAFSRGRRRALVDVLVTSGSGSFWQILAPGDRREAAQQAIARRRAELEAEAGEAAKAAEEEEAATENHVVVGEAESEAVALVWAQRLASAGIAAVLRAREDVDVEPAEPGDPPVTLVLVPGDAAERARALLRGG